MKGQGDTPGPPDQGGTPGPPDQGGTPGPPARLLDRARAAAVTRVRIVAGARHRPVMLVGAAVLVLGACSPWASFDFGFTGRMTEGGSPGGARIFPLVLGAIALLALVDLAGRRRMGLAAATGAVAITAGNMLAIVDDGGRFGALDWGAWLALAGGLLMLLATLALPDDRPRVDWPRLANPIELLVVSATMGTTLALVWWGLDIEESSRFSSFVAFVSFGATALGRLGLFDWLLSLFERHRAITVAAAGIAAAAFPFTQGGNAYWVRVFASIGVFAAAAIGLNIVVGLAGLLDLGYVAFFGVGAYAGALLSGAALTTVDVHLPFLVVVLIGALIAAVFGLIIGAPTLRLRGDYLAIVTLGFGEIFRISANNMDGLTRGPNGISGVPDLAMGDFNFAETHTVFGVDLPGFANYYLAELVLLAGVILVFSRLNDSRIGRAWVAIREDETAASAMGVDTVRLKLLAFAIGAFLAGAAGTVNAHVTTQVSPDSYTFEQSILFVAAVVLGGMGTVPGALLGSSILFVIPEKLRAFQDKRFLFFGAALVVMMRFRPEGVLASRRRQLELHEGTETGDALSAPPGSPPARGPGGVPL